MSKDLFFISDLHIGGDGLLNHCDFSEWGSAFPNRLLAAATIDRLRHNACRVTLDGPSYRGERETKKQK